MRATILLGILCVIGMVQVLPQVDLPDTTFHEDTLPQAARCGASIAHAVAVVASPAEIRHELAVSHSEQLPVALHPLNQSIPTLFSTLLC